MKHSLIYCVFFALMFAITACGDDGDSATRPSDESSSSVTLSSLSSAGIAPMSSWSGGEAGTIGSSNSVVQSSSSESMSVVDPASVVKGTFSDSRDGQTYKTVTIGTQTWMAQNLNYETANSYCHNDSVEYCSKYGRHYTWAAAKKACPSGWHLPAKAEFETLLSAVGGDSVAMAKLKSTSGWIWNNDVGKIGNGTDDYSFSALPAGGRTSFRYNNGAYFNEGRNAFFWSSSEYSDGKDSDCAYYMSLWYGDGIAYLGYYGKDNFFSVRCVKD